MFEHVGAVYNVLKTNARGNTVSGWLVRRVYSRVKATQTVQQLKGEQQQPIVCRTKQSQRCPLISGTSHSEPEPPELDFYHVHSLRTNKASVACTSG